jgi:hypothetical protein
MSTALATRPITDLDDQSLGAVLAKSGFFSDTRDAAQAIVKVLAGRELGFGPVASMVGIHVIKGKPVISATLLGAAIKRSGRYSYRITRLDDTGCEITFYEGKEALIPASSFTLEDAKSAGLLNNDTWRKFPRNMLFARALSNGARWHCPDIFGGPIYTPDELGVPVNEEGEVIEVSAPPVVEQSAPASMFDVIPDKLSGPVSEVESKYSDAGDLTIRFKLAGYTCLVRKAAAFLLYLEDGDPVVAKGKMGKCNGAPCLHVDNIYHAEDTETWTNRSNESIPAL